MVGRAHGLPTLVFTDTESATLSNKFTFPFATQILTPRCYYRDAGPRHVRYDGYHELAYLHPKYFRPDPSITADLRVRPGERYSIVRFVRWKAAHDFGLAGHTDTQKVAVVRALSEHGRVFVSSEEALPAELAEHAFPLPPTRIHDAIAGASIVFGESATMCSEAAVLGVPSVFIHPDPIGRGYTQEQVERWKIVQWFTPDRIEAAITAASAIVAARSTDDATDRWRAIGRELVASSIDVTELICRQVLDCVPQRAAA
jgi:predicted glycosyltransferase